MKKVFSQDPTRVLCYLDLGRHSIQVVSYAYRVARIFDARLFMLHTVTDIKGAAGFYVPHINTDKLEEEVIKAASDKMYSICHEVIGDVDPANRLVMRGNPLLVINEVIQDQGIDLLVLGHDVSKGTLSSFKVDLAEKLLKQPPCPLLVVPVTEG